MNLPTDWEVRLEHRSESPEAAQRLFQVLAPEASREVPRARAVLRPPEGPVLLLEISAKDTGGLRAAVQTYLGWLQLAEATERVGRPPSAGDAPSAP
jgi:tRNA threonylcarbamoyladenosine modification (KEOPS) complex  Pcc1 subunit